MAVPVMGVGPMGVGMLPFLVRVFVRVRPTTRTRSGPLCPRGGVAPVPVIMVVVMVAMKMGVVDAFMPVGMAVPFEDNERGPGGHQEKAGQEGPTRRLAQQGERGDSTDERGEVKRSGAEGAQP
jgi:hypothetical protein